MGIQINGNTNNINAGIGSLSIEDLNELDIVGVATASNFKTGSSNLHSTGLTVGNNFLHSTGINVGTGATIHVPATNVLTFGTNSNERVRITSNGRVGINSTAPTKPLDVVGSAEISSALTVGGALNASGTCTLGQTVSLNGTNPRLQFVDTNHNSDYSIYGSNGRFTVYDDTNSAERFRINSTGKITHTYDGTAYDAQFGQFEITKNGASNADPDWSYLSFHRIGQIGWQQGIDSNHFVIATTGGSAKNTLDSEKLRIQSNGRVGVGSDNPQHPLDVFGNIRSHQQTPSLYLQTTANTAESAIIRFGDAGSFQRGAIQYDFAGDNHLRFKMGGLGNNVERLTLKGTNGNLGINRNTPVAPITARRLDAGGTGTSGVIAEFANSSGYGVWFGQSSASGAAWGATTGDFYWATGGLSSQTERLRITSSGQLLLGETSAFDSNTAIQFRKDNAGGTSDFVFRNRGNNNSSRVQIKLSTLNRAANADVSSGIEKYQSGGMAIYNGENTNQYATMGFHCNGYRSLLLRNGNHSGYDVAHFYAYWGTSNGIHMEQGGPQSGTHKAIRFTTSHYGGERGYIGVTLGGTSYNSSSDYRMKQDVVDLTGAIDRVKSFKPRRFKWKEDPTYTVDGFLAHEASTVVPESVDGEKDAVDENGDPKYQVMDNSRLVPVLTAALKEAIAKIETLETKVAALEGS